ncbi:MAG: glycosyltransferase family 39 protein, partial [Chloroflexales bacterium]
PSPREGEGLGVRVALALLGAVLLLALALRLYRIDTLPFGLWRDEARHGLTALRMAADPAYRPAYVTDLRVQLPGLGLAPFAVALQLLGVYLWTMRLVTAVAGALTVLPVYALVTRLGGRRGVGLLAALLVAISSWQITISRFSFPTVFEPLLTWGGLWLLDRALRPGGGRAARPAAIIIGGLLAGACFGLAAQTYHIGRFAPLMGGLLALATIIERRDWRRWLLAVLPAALGCLLVLAPLIGYAIRQPDDFNGRVGAVFVLSEEARQGRAPLAVLDDSLRRHLLMFNVQGDLNGRHHAPGRPMLDYVTGLGFLLGLAALLRRIAGWRSMFLLAALGVGLLPSALSVDSPHGMRAFEAAPLACAIAALGMAELLRMLWPAGPRQRRIVAWGASAALGLALALNVWVYFAIMPPDPQVFLGFYPVQSQMGVYVRAAADARAGGRIYVPRAVAADQIFAFLSAGLPVETFDGAALSSPPRPGDHFLLSGYFADQEAAALTPVLGPDPLAEGPGFPDGRGPTFLVYQIPMAP